VTTLRVDPWQPTPGVKTKIRQGPVWYVDAKKADIDTDVERVVLDIVKNTKKLKDVDVSELITEGEIEQTMEGASNLTLTLHDPDSELLALNVFNQALDIQLDGLWFRMIGIQKEGSFLTLTFEDRIVSYLKTHNKIVRMSRGKMTRLEFCYYLVKQINKRIEVVIPELHRKPTFEQLTRQDKSSLEISKERNRGQGLPNQKFKIYNADGSETLSTPRQNRMMEDVLDAGFL
jgi:hypothetical protein